jgi:azurin
MAQENPEHGVEPGAVLLEISSDGNLMAYDRATLAAPAGQSVTLTFYNRSTVHQHSWVLVNGGLEVADQVYAMAVAAGPDRDYMPEGEAAILAYTELVDSGMQDTISFVAPAVPGEYTYLCTFPGHYLAGMKGTLVLTNA